MRRLNKNQRGFTVLELMIATVVFSVLLLGATAMMIQIGRLFYKGVLSARTQETTRTITDDIGRALQFGGDGVKVPPPITINPAGAPAPLTVRAFCVGNVRYTYLLDVQVSNAVAPEQFDPTMRQNYGRHAMWRDNFGTGTCEPNPDILLAEPSPLGREMLGEGMRLFALTPPEEDSSNGLVSFSVGIVFGNDEELIVFTDNPDGSIEKVQCRGIGLGSQWCATSLLETTVFRRVDG